MDDLKAREVLDKFMMELKQWTIRGGNSFKDDRAICSNLLIWLDVNLSRQEYLWVGGFVISTLRHDLGNRPYPFGGPEVFSEEFNAGTFWKNKERLAFIDKYLEGMEKRGKRSS